MQKGHIREDMYVGILVVRQLSCYFDWMYAVMYLFCCSLCCSDAEASSADGTPRIDVTIAACGKL